MNVAARIAAGLTLAWAVACSRTLGDAPDLSGNVTRVAHPAASFQPTARFYVAPAPSTAPAGAAGMPVTVTGTSEIFLVERGKQRRVDHRALQAGQRVDVWFTQTTPETRPALGQAAKVVIYSET